MSDWNNEKTNGWVRDPSGTEDRHSPFVGKFSVGLISEYGSGSDTFQLAFARDQYEKVRTYIKFRAYDSDNKVWGEWEWFNPPMALGVEYRTTERYLGKPVYAKLVDVGVLPNNTVKSVAHGISNMSDCINIFGHDTANHRPIPSLNFNGNLGATIGITTTETNIVIATNFDASDTSGRVALMYTKATD